MSHSLHPEAEKELASAASFYQSQAGNALAQAFLSEFDCVARILDRHPGVGKPTRGGLRIHRCVDSHWLDLRNSGDTACDRSRVVGYAALAFAEPLRGDMNRG